MKSYRPEYVPITSDALVEHLRLRHPAATLEAIQAMAQHWVEVQDAIDGQSRKRDRNFYLRQRPWEDPHVARKDGEDTPQDDEAA